jgi:hypothetical protein
MIVTANKFYNERFEDWKIKYLVPMMLRHGLTGIVPRLNSSAKPVYAFVEHGRWLAKCECGGAEAVWDEGLFMCQSCWNSAYKHNFRPVVFPEQRQEIEAILELRPLLNRNWLLGETVAQLRKENKEHENELLEISSNPAAGH